MARCYIRWFEDIGADDVASVGGKNASLGEMVRNLGVTTSKYHPALPSLLTVTGTSFPRTSLKR